MNLTRHNYEEYFLLYVDGELAADERLTVEAFLAEHMDLAEQMDDLQRTVLSPDETFAFDKELVYQFSAAAEPAKVVPLANRPFSWAAAAAVVCIAAGSLWLLKERVGPHPAHNPVAETGSRNSGAGTTPATSPSHSVALPEVTPTASVKIPNDHAPAGPGFAGTVIPKGTSPKFVKHPAAGDNPEGSTPSIAEGSSNPGNNPTPEGIALLHPTGPATLTEPRSVTAPQLTNAGGPNAIAQITTKVPTTVTTSAAPSYHTLEDGEQDGGGDKILFVQADPVVNGEVKGFFRRAGRLLKRSASFNTDNIHSDPGTEK